LLAVPDDALASPKFAVAVPSVRLLPPPPPSMLPASVPAPVSVKASPPLPPASEAMPEKPVTPMPSNAVPVPALVTEKVEPVFDP
jgi:hypothetical protein